MEQYNMKANFYPAVEPKNGYIGFADLTISSAIRVRGIAVFENKDGAGYHIQFPSYGENGDSFVIPSCKDAYHQMLSVIESAVKDEGQHFGWVTGKMNPRLEVSGRAVNEPYADGRYSIKVGDLCTLRGVATRDVTYERDGQEKEFISVDLPTLPPYERDGEKIYPPVFEGLKDSYEKDGEHREKDFGFLIRKLVLSQRKKLLEQHPPLESQVADAAQKAGNNAPTQETPELAAVR